MLDYVDSRARWKILSLSFALFIVLFALSLYSATLFVYKWIGIIFGCAVILTAIIPHRLGKKNSAMYLLSISMNAIGTGLAVSAYYIVKEKPVSVTILLIMPVIAVLAYALVNLLASVFTHKKLVLSVFGVIFLALLVLFVVLWIKDGSFIASFGFFNTLFLIMFLAVSSLTLGNPERVALRDLSFGAFGTFVIATLLVIAILSEGDVVDGIDIADVTGKNKKDAKAKNPSSHSGF